MYLRMTLKKWVLLLMVLVLSVVLVACGGGTTAPAPTEAAEVEGPPAEPTDEPPLAQSEAALTVFAAASLTDAFGEIAGLFEAANPGVTTVFNFAGSNQLATQINEDAPVDVFASANTAQMNAAVESGRIDAAAPVIFVTNRLVVVIPADNPGNIVNLQDLAALDTLIVLAAEGVPAGHYSLEFLDLASADPAFGESFREDVLANVVSYEENVRSVLNKVSLGEADAGIVYTSDLVGIEGVSQVEIPDALNVLAEYPLAILNDSPNADMARAFISYILSPEGQQVLSDYGFGSPQAR